MRQVKETPYKEVGLKLRAIRDYLDLTLKELSMQANLSLSYISEFERGAKHPMFDYLRFLHDRYNVDLNYVFGSSPRMFRPTPEEEALNPKFGNFDTDVREMLKFCKEMPPALYSVLGFFAEYRVKNRQLIDDYFKFYNKDVPPL